MTVVFAAACRVFRFEQEGTEGMQELYAASLAVKGSICRQHVRTDRLIGELIVSTRFRSTDDSATFNLVVAYASTGANHNPGQK